MADKELEVKLLIKMEGWKKQLIINKILDFLKELEIIKVEMEEK